MKTLVARAAVIVMAAAGLCTIHLGAPSAAAGPSQAHAVAGVAPVASGPIGTTAAKQGRDGRGYRVRPGVTFNDPWSRPMVTRIKLLGALNHTWRGQRIRVMTWSFFDSMITDALIAAHRRGVTVQFIMSRGLSTDAQAGHNYSRLRRALVNRPGTKPHKRSFARTCSHSCRGGGGAMHSKWVTISKVDKSKFVVMQGSANLNIRAAVDQWNDWYTFVGNKKIYRTYQTIFEQAQLDRRAPAVTAIAGTTQLWFAPRKNDPVMAVLDQVRCVGARKAGLNGRTVIRVASAVIQGRRGESIAWRLRQLHRQGCNIRLIYTLAPKKVRQAWGGVPTQHMAFDNNDDGLYDDYMHMKAMSISGWVGTDRSAGVVYNGSANWSKMGMVSDEQGTIMLRPLLARQYIRWIDTVFNKGQVRSREQARARARGGVVVPHVADPYANVELQ